MVGTISGWTKRDLIQPDINENYSGMSDVQCDIIDEETGGKGCIGSSFERHLDLLAAVMGQ